MSASRPTTKAVGGPADREELAVLALELADLRADSAALRQELAERRRTQSQLRRQQEVQSDALIRSQRTVALRNARLVVERATIDALNDRLTETEARAEERERALTSALEGAHRELRRVEESVSWQLFLRGRSRLFDRLGGEHSDAVHALQAGMRRLGRRVGVGLTQRAPDAPPAAMEPVRPPEPIVFRTPPHPEVSIVMPLHARADLTRAALESILLHTPFPDYELILVEDAADPGTHELLDVVHGAEIVRNPDNLGYQQSIHAGVSRARADWLVLCNNDIVVRPGWLDALLEGAHARPDVGIVTPKYLFADGSIAEAGGIIWRDATGANYLRGEPSASCHAAYRREVDYGSAAALLVRAGVWEELGGFDRRFAPMYYEDADLCFAARANGWRVMYEPRAEVIHLEGSTAGTDETTGPKLHQTRNRPRFAEKWWDQLEASHAVNDLERWWAAADRASGPRVFVVDHTVPTWDRDAGSLRMYTILVSLVELGCRVTLMPDNHAPLQPYTRRLEDAGVEVLYGVDPVATLQRIGPELDLILLSRPQPAARWVDSLRAIAPQAQILYDTVDLHWLREARGAALVAGQSEPLMTPRAQAVQELENALMRVTDGTIVVTETEGAVVGEQVPNAITHVVPIGNQVRTEVPPARGRGGLVFVGGFRHPPNLDAAMLLAVDVMPRIWAELPDLKLTIVGADPPPELVEHASERIEVRGWVEDLGPVLAGARAMLAPIRFGAGLKGKVTQAMAEGLPVVTTPLGAEGLEVTSGDELLIGHDSGELAAHAVQLVRDDALWDSLSREGRRLMTETGSPAVIKDRLRTLLSGIPVRA